MGCWAVVENWGNDITGITLIITSNKWIIITRCLPIAAMFLRVHRFSSVCCFHWLPRIYTVVGLPECPTLLLMACEIIWVDDWLFSEQWQKIDPWRLEDSCVMVRERCWLELSTSDSRACLNLCDYKFCNNNNNNISCLRKKHATLFLSITFEFRGWLL